MKSENIVINGNQFFFKLYYESRERSSVSIRSNKVNIRIPTSLNREEQFKELIRMKKWANEKISQRPKRFKPEEIRTYFDGELLKVGSEEYILRINFKEKQSSSVKIDRNEITLTISSNLSNDLKNKHISTLLSRIIGGRRLDSLKIRMEEINNFYFKQNISKVFFKNQKSRWGSCSEKGNINISTRLLFAPTDVLEYVCVHELAHRKEFNHSDKFWSLVESVMPDYKEKEQWLKENGNKCLF